MSSQWDPKPETRASLQQARPSVPVSDYDQDRIHGSIWKWTLGPEIRELERYQRVLPVKQLRDKLKEDPRKLQQPIEITISGTLFTCALLSSGWWDRPPEKQVDVGAMTGFQRWWFHGFDHWAPSWNISWSDDAKDMAANHVIAQIGYEDEADSLPLLIPRAKADEVRNMLDRRWGGMEAKARGWLGHWSQYKARHQPRKVIRQFEGLLDYCLWIEDEEWQNGKHFVQPLKESSQRLETETYSGYLWKCVAPRAALPLGSDGKVDAEKITIDKVYFLWDHTNFSDEKAVECSLLQLEKKEEFLKSMGVGDLQLVQKSSDLVPEPPLLTGYEQFFRLLQRSASS